MHPLPFRELRIFFRFHQAYCPVCRDIPDFQSIDLFPETFVFRIAYYIFLFEYHDTFPRFQFQ